MSRYLALIIALVSGALAVVLIYGYVDRMKKDVYKGMDLVPVLVAATDIAEGTQLSQENVAFRQYPQKFVSDRSIGTKEGRLVIGALTKFNIEAGKPIFWSDIEEVSRSEEGVAELLQTGMTTFVLPVTDITGVAGLLKPNQRIDILYSFDLESLQGARSPEEIGVAPQSVDTLKKYVMSAMASEAGSAANPATAVLLQNVLILTTGTADEKQGDSIIPTGQGSDKNEKYSSITLMVSPWQARLLTFCMNQGTLSVTLRRTGDAVVAKQPEMITKEIVLKALMSSEDLSQKMKMVE